MRFLIPILFGFLNLSCEQRILYEEYVSLPYGWHENKPILFRYQTTDTLSKHHLYIMLRNDEQYPYSNIFLITKMETPDNKIVTDTLEYEMASPDGKWLGEGMSIKESKLWYKENVIFPSKGTYTFSIEQADRSIGQNKGVENLQGILEVGLQIEKATKK
ncbi:gliding motility lipoprotein GldH [Capnocytophaga catalasegens]|uniref:Gliding motility lipoprotein GldH n=1 Tax=Capnocytophaga catalasegens TaxID=1004260 RepID=A0AAV5AWK8_9FLAO|nr:gliding motility lipoprotein GldH [Capnocytophaga catalasegens]GIZ15688.1 gliding motility lipoprotein GldH [Capnocytophaga catalasegens]GJM50075.1 gliding motility lipoprotein GldH [Capnocytophaga catalasegens]GJM53100.1 gliding motility lipoprotein GldH [Capnocytophaga catalasegens]